MRVERVTTNPSLYGLQEEDSVPPLVELAVNTDILVDLWATPTAPPLRSGLWWLVAVVRGLRE